MKEKKSFSKKKKIKVKWEISIIKYVMKSIKIHSEEECRVWFTLDGSYWTENWKKKIKSWQKTTPQF